MRYEQITIFTEVICKFFIQITLFTQTSCSYYVHYVSHKFKVYNVFCTVVLCMYNVKYQFDMPLSVYSMIEDGFLN